MVLASSADVLADDESEDSDDSGDVRHDFISTEIYTLLHLHYLYLWLY